MTRADKAAFEKEKKDYHSPVIRFYGAVRTLTETAGMLATAASDGGTNSGMNKTR